MSVWKKLFLLNPLDTPSEGLKRVKILNSILGKQRQISCHNTY